MVKLPTRCCRVGYRAIHPLMDLVFVSGIIT